jgi:hypothetical protein
MFFWLTSLLDLSSELSSSSTTSYSLALDWLISYSIDSLVPSVLKYLISVCSLRAFLSRFLRVFGLVLLEMMNSLLIFLCVSVMALCMFYIVGYVE